MHVTADPVDERKDARKEAQSLSAPAREFSNTIFIILDAGTAIRNILRTNVLARLKQERDLRIVVFSPLADEEFKKEFECENVIVEPIVHWKPNFLVKTFRSLRKDIWIRKFDLTRFKEKRSRKGRKLSSLTLDLLIGKSESQKIDRIVARLQHLEERFTPNLAESYIRKYQPDLLFYTTLYSKDHCLELAARARGIKTAAFIMSWDNPTTKGPFPVRPDRLVVWNGILRDELMKYHGLREEQICVAGVPQFDIYTDRSGYRSREDFFRKWKLDPEKKLITYTTGTPGTAPFDDEMVDLLYQKMRAGAFRQNCQLLVRLHPKDLYEPYRKFENKPDLVIQLPGRKANTSDSWNPTHDDMYGLAELMCYSDVVVNIASTTTIDASAFDTPVVNVAFDGYKTKPYEHSCRRYYEFEHYKRVVQTGGFKISYSIDELVAHIQQYLDDPKLDAEGRAHIRQEQCWKLDGKAGERIAEFLLDYLKQPKSVR